MYAMPDRMLVRVEPHLTRKADRGRCAWLHCTNVEAELAGVHIWEKIFAKEWRHENEREHHDRHHGPDHEPCVVKRPLQPGGVRVPQLLETTVKSFVEAEEPISVWRLEFIGILLVLLILSRNTMVGTTVRDKK